MHSNKPLLLMMIFAVLFFSGCAYFNTFYNANLAYNTAHSEHQTLMNENPDSLFVAPTSSIIKNYDRAIEKSVKMMDLYPDDNRWAGDAVFLIGKALYYKGEHFIAISQLRSFQRQYPENENIPLSHLYKGKAYILTGNLNAAEETLEYLIEQYPHFDRDHQVTMLLVEVAYRRGGRSQAISLLEQILDTSVPESKRSQLLLRTAELYIELNQFSRAYSLLRSVPRTREMPLMYRVDRALLVCYTAGDTLDQALEFVSEMLGNRRYYLYRDELLLEKGFILRNMGRVYEAIEILEMLVASIDSEQSEVAARAWAALARMYQVNLGDLNTAAQAYSEASRSSDTSVANYASRKFKAIEELERLRNPDSLDTRLPEQRNYKIAELFKFELANADSAFFHFMDLTHGDLEDSTLIPRALSMAAIIARTDLKDTVVSDSIYNLVIENYPGTEFARNAQAAMGLPVTIETPAVLAEREFKRAEALYYDEGDVVEAIRVFFNIHREFPDLDIAPKSLFAAAYLTDNVLQRNRSALTLYERLCELYPDSEQCTKSASPRIKIAQDTIRARQGIADVEENKAEPVPVDRNMERHQGRPSVPVSSPGGGMSGQQPMQGPDGPRRRSPPSEE
ncbi:hypothetical protein CHISP_0110 [Chitinispirillum alkaliphilum]|nr:hypothetical protein CHISP_0110 [Chitinispirillum alkaliphilum]